MSRILIIYYSRKGENYWNGYIKHLTQGNTAVIAQMIADLTGGDLFEIDTAVPYPEGYYDCIQQAKTELQENARPALRAYPNSLGRIRHHIFRLSQLVGHHANAGVYTARALRSDRQAHFPLLHQ